MIRIAAALLAALVAGPATAADPIKIDVDVVFTRTKPNPSKDEYKLKFVRRDTMKSLDDDPIVLQLNDVVSLQVTSPNAARMILVDRWEGLEQWESKVKRGKTTTFTLEWVPHCHPIEARLGAQTVLTTAFRAPAGVPAPDNYSVGPEAGPTNTIKGAQTELRLVGLVSAVSPVPALKFAGRPKNGWKQPPVRVPVAPAEVAWYAVTVSIARN